MNAFDQMAAAGNLLGIAMQIPDTTLSLTEVLEQYAGDVERAATHRGLLRTWTDAAPETRSALLLSLAWGARTGELAAGEDTACVYARDLHTYAHDFQSDSEAFHGPRYPAMPLPGQAGALASSLGFDRDDNEISSKPPCCSSPPVPTPPRAEPVSRARAPAFRARNRRRVRARPTPTRQYTWRCHTTRRPRCPRTSSTARPPIRSS